MLEKIKKHPMLVAIGLAASIIGSIATLTSVPDKICEFSSKYIDASRVENGLSPIWTGVRKVEVLENIGSPLISRKFDSEEVAIYLIENGYLAVGFTEDGIVSQFILAIPEEKLANFTGYQLHYPEVYGEFLFGQDLMSKHGAHETLEAGVGAQSAYVNIQIDPPFIIRKGGYFDKIELKFFDTRWNGNYYSFGVPSSALTSETTDLIDYCEPEDCTEAQRERAISSLLETLPGWLHVSSSDAAEISDEWLVKQFSIASKAKVKKGGWFSQICLGVGK